MPMEVETVRSPAGLREFVRLPFRLYRETPQWAPPLLRAEYRLLDPQRHPFHRHAQVQYALAKRDGRVVGRIAAIRNDAHNRFHNDRVGFWGFFDCENDLEAAQALFRSAESFLREQGCTSSRGPMNFSVNETCGLLIQGFEHPSVFMMPYNFPYYRELAESCGYCKAMDLLTFSFDRNTVAPDAIRHAGQYLIEKGVKLREVDRRRLREECRIINELYNDAWSENWGFVPMTKEEVNAMAAELAPILDPRLSLVAEIDGVPAAVALGLPNVNPLLRSIRGRLFPFGWLRLLLGLRRLREFRGLLLGVAKKYRPLGLGIPMMLRLIERSLDAGIESAEVGWCLETNRLVIRMIERAGGRPKSKYRIFEKEL